MTTLLTFGHGEASQARLIELLASAGVGMVVDVRRFPGSRRHPHVAQDKLGQWMPTSGIAYRWEPRLGGRRRVPRDRAAADPWWQVEAFRGYAAHTRAEEFGSAAVDLLADVSTRRDDRVAIMCSESLWWRCHRRLIADVVVLLHHSPVHHLSHDGKFTEQPPGTRSPRHGRGVALRPTCPIKLTPAMTP